MLSANSIRQRFRPVRPFWHLGAIFVVVFIWLGLVSGCSGWKPDEGSSSYKGSYSATRDGYYRVKRGDTLHAIAFKLGMDWKNIAAWNGIRAPYTIYPDQELRLSPSGSGTGASIASTSGSTGSGKTVVTAAPARNSTSTTYDNPPEASTTAPATNQPATKTPNSSKPAESAASSSKVASTSSAGKPDPGSWLWPTDGRVVSNFKPNDPARKGMDIGGKKGQAIVASAAGEVVYSGSGLIGYGELIIIKHNERLLSAYAHNSKRLVTEGQKISGGDKIAEMGKNDRNQALLHFEIRLNGIPQDPKKYLPGR